MAALLKAQAEALPATIRAAMALRDLGLLTPLDGEDHLLTVDPVAAAGLPEKTVLALHRAGALALLHAGLVSLAHLPWMAKAESHPAARSSSKSPSQPVRKRAASGSDFLTALAAETSADVAPLPFPGHSPS